uniref:NP-Pse-3 n=1 Tax=Pseudonaja modesta TaxID=340912 RepID=R4G312_9SAUR
MVGLSRLAGGGLLLLLLALLPLALDGKPAPLPQALPEAPAGGVMASVTEEQQRLPVSAEESPDPAAGRSGSKVAKLGSGCFGNRLDHIGTASGMGCNWPNQNRPNPTPAGS